MRVLTVFLAALLILAAVGLYDVKYRAEATERAIAILNHEIRDEEEALRILRAEWSYLNTPERLQGFANRYLSELRPLAPNQIGTFEDLPLKPRPDDLYGSMMGQSFGDQSSAGEILRENTRVGGNY